jgi:hypothetical protein
MERERRDENHVNARASHSATYCLTFTSLTVYCFAIRAARVCVSGLLLFTKVASKK